MMAGFLKMYVDWNISELLRAKYGNNMGISVFMFFEQWRNFGEDYVRQAYPERTYYKYIDLLIDVGLVVRERYGTYKIVPAYEHPVQA